VRTANPRRSPTALASSLKPAESRPKRRRPRGSGPSLTPAPRPAPQATPRTSGLAGTRSTTSTRPRTPPSPSAPHASRCLRPPPPRGRRRRRPHRCHRPLLRAARGPRRRRRQPRLALAECSTAQLSFAQLAGSQPRLPRVRRSSPSPSRGSSRTASRPPRAARRRGRCTEAAPSLLPTARRAAAGRPSAARLCLAFLPRRWTAARGAGCLSCRAGSSRCPCACPPHPPTLSPGWICRAREALIHLPRGGRAVAEQRGQAGRGAAPLQRRGRRRRPPPSLRLAAPTPAVGRAGRARGRRGGQRSGAATVADAAPLLPARPPDGLAELRPAARLLVAGRGTVTDGACDGRARRAHVCALGCRLCPAFSKMGLIPCQCVLCLNMGRCNV